MFETTNQIEIYIYIGYINRVYIGYEIESSTNHTRRFSKVGVNHRQSFFVHRFCHRCLGDLTLDMTSDMN